MQVKTQSRISRKQLDVRLSRNFELRITMYDRVDLGAA
jgi:hypothetical protein